MASIDSTNRNSPLVTVLSPTAPSSVQKQAMVRRVFGESIDTSLDYSAASSRLSSCSGQSTDHNAYGGTAQQTRMKSVDGGGTSALLNETDKENSVLIQTPGSTKSILSVSSSCEQSNSVSSSNTSALPPRTPESTKSSSSTSSSRILAPFGNLLTPNDKDKESIASDSGKCSPPSLEKPAIPRVILDQARQTRLQARSPLKPDLVRQTQRAIQQASKSVAAQQHMKSVNLSIAHARRSKQAHLTSKRSQTARQKQNWQQEKEVSKQYLSSSEEQRRRLLNLKVSLMSQNSQERADRRMKERSEELERLDSEAKFNSSVYRDHQYTLKIQADARRRASVQARRKLRVNHLKGQQALQMARIEEDQALLNERHESSRAITQYGREQAENRRASYQFRAGDARRIREIHNQLENERQMSEQASLQLKRAGNKDAEAYQRKCALDRRESLAGRGRDKVEQRERMAQLASQELMTEQESLQLKREGDKDAEAYRRKCADDRRDSFANRGKAHSLQRQRAVELKSKALADEQASLQLKREGDKDAEAYRRRVQEERRESLENRNRERARHAQVMQELSNIAQQQESESLALEMAGHRDAQEYLRELAAERRRSLQLRGRDMTRRRDCEREMHYQEICRQHEDEEWRSGDHQDVQQYQKDCAERDRASFEYSHKQAHKTRIEQEAVRIQRQLREAENFELETKAYADVQDYLKSCRERRRMSLACRAKEQRRRWRVRHEREAAEREANNRDARDRVADALAVEMARQLEVTQKAIDGLQHAHF